jgi:hypothetical protein
VNAIKHAIDELKGKVDAHHLQAQRDGVFGKDGVIDEVEFALLNQLREAKQQYRTAFDVLAGLRSDIAYCDRLVTQCRVRLLTDFDLWYRETYGDGPSAPGDEQQSPDQVCLVVNAPTKGAKCSHAVYAAGGRHGSGNSGVHECATHNSKKGTSLSARVSRKRMLTRNLFLLGVDLQITAQQASSTGSTKKRHVQPVRPVTRGRLPGAAPASLSVLSSP